MRSPNSALHTYTEAVLHQEELLQFSILTLDHERFLVVPWGR